MNGQGARGIAPQGRHGGRVVRGGAPPPWLSGPAIGVALKLAPRRVDVDPLNGEVTPDRAPAGPSPAGLAALEIALRLRDAWQARVTVAAVGTAAAEPMLRDALARGADSAIRIQAPRGPGAAAPGMPPALAATAGALAAALAGCPVVLCGDGGHDGGTGAVPALLAAHGGRAQALGLVSVEPAHEPGAVRAERRLDRGWRERLAVRTPMLLSVESGIAQPRRAPLEAVLAARSATITVAPWPGADGHEGGGHQGGGGGGTGHQGEGRGGADHEGGGRGGADHEGGGRGGGGHRGAGHDGGDRAEGATTVMAYRPRARVLQAPQGESPLARVLSLLGADGRREPPERVDAEPAAAAQQILDKLRSWGYL